MHTDDLLWDRHKRHEPTQVDIDLVCVVWRLRIRLRIRVGEEGGERNRDVDVDPEGLSGEETGVIFRLVNAEAVRRTGEFIVSPRFCFALFSNIFCGVFHANLLSKDRTRSVCGHSKLLVDVVLGVLMMDSRSRC
jgi:hypothetical protein